MKGDHRYTRPADDPEEAPETPTDEPKPTPVQDPPAEPGKSPYVVSDIPGGQPPRESSHE